MKKALLGLLLVLVVLFAVLYAAAPPAAIAENVLIEASPNTIYRCFTDKKLVQRWWNASANVVATTSQNVQLTDNGFTYTITPKPFNVVDIVVQDGGRNVQTFVSLVPLQGDSVEVNWKGDVSSNSIFSKVGNAGRTRTLKRQMETVLQQLRTFIQSEKNIYGFAVQHTRVTDTLLAVTKVVETTPPTVETYYGLIKKLRAYIAQAGAQEVDYPMLNISQPDSTHYQTMVAIPVNRPVPGAGAIVAKRMIPGDILVAEVKGGNAAIREGFHQLDLYVAEHKLVQPGLPFQSLVTDRLTEPDTAQWVTKLYYPVEK